MRGKQFIIQKATNKQRELIRSLLRAEKLPADDLPDSLENFFVSVDNDKVIAAIGIEKYENCGLLRSLVVDSAYRNKNLGSDMLKSLENRAVELDMDCIYLLTETAASYFEKKGYEIISRDEMPESVKTSSEFSFVCPVSAIVMKKSIR